MQRTLPFAELRRIIRERDGSAPAIEGGPDANSGSGDPADDVTAAEIVEMRSAIRAKQVAEDVACWFVAHAKDLAEELPSGAKRRAAAATAPSAASSSSSAALSAAAATAATGTAAATTVLATAASAAASVAAASSSSDIDSPAPRGATDDGSRRAALLRLQERWPRASVWLLAVLSAQEVTPGHMQHVYYFESRAMTARQIIARTTSGEAGVGTGAGKGGGEGKVGGECDGKVREVGDPLEEEGDGDEEAMEEAREAMKVSQAAAAADLLPFAEDVDGN